MLRRSRETRSELVAGYAALAERYERRAWREELLLGAPEIGPVTCLCRRLRLRAWRRGLRLARADVERHRRSQSERREA